MTTQSVTAEILGTLAELPPEQQREVLAFARSLKPQPRGVKGAALLGFAGSIAADDLAQMQGSIEEECGRIDADEW